jgi:crossover junction endodeoxyribonuclease RuvC
MIVLGVDPGSHATGYGVVDVDGSRLRFVDAGTIRAAKSDDLARRLRTIHEALVDVVESNSPTVMAVENVFNARNPRSSLILGQARGAALLAGSLNDIPVAEYAPREVKMALTGNGAATKEQLRWMVTRLLALPQPPKSLDASDALGVALCHAMRSGAPVALRGAVPGKETT